MGIITVVKPEGRAASASDARFLVQQWMGTKAIHASLVGFGKPHRRKGSSEQLCSGLPRSSIFPELTL